MYNSIHFIMYDLEYSDISKVTYAREKVEEIIKSKSTEDIYTNNFALLDSYYIVNYNCTFVIEPTAVQIFILNNTSLEKNGLQAAGNLIPYLPIYLGEDIDVIPNYDKLSRVFEYLDLSAEISSIEGLEDNWNGNSAKPIPKDVINMTRNIIHMFPTLPMVYPVAIEGVQLEWEIKKDEEIYIEININLKECGIFYEISSEGSKSNTYPINKLDKVIYLASSKLSHYVEDNRYRVLGDLPVVDRINVSIEELYSRYEAAYIDYIANVKAEKEQGVYYLERNEDKARIDELWLQILTYVGAIY